MESATRSFCERSIGPIANGAEESTIRPSALYLSYNVGGTAADGGGWLEVDSPGMTRCTTLCADDTECQAGHSCRAVAANTSDSSVRKSFRQRHRRVFAQVLPGGTASRPSVWGAVAQDQMSSAWRPFWKLLKVFRNAPVSAS